MRKLLMIIIVTIVLAITTIVRADISKQIRYQGQASNTQGEPLNGNYDMGFAIYDALIRGSKLWEEIRNSIPISKGNFSVILGEVNPINITFDKDCWIEVVVSGQTLSPRQKITTVPTAIRAETAEIAIKAETALRAEAAETAVNAETAVRAETAEKAIELTGGLSVSDSYAKLFLHNNGTDTSKTFVDTSSAGNLITAYGDVQIDTAQSKFGGASVLFDGSGDYLSIPDSDDWYFGTGDFTIDFWVRFNDLVDDHYSIVSQYADPSNYWYLWKYRISEDNKLAVTFVDNGVIKANYQMANHWPGCAINTWYHIAVSRIGTTCKIFIDGVSQSLIEATAFGTNDVGNIAAQLQIGGYNSGYNYILDGWLDEFRISKGIARWTENFTPPTKEYADNSAFVINSENGAGYYLGNVGVGTASPTEKLDVAGSVKAEELITNEIVFDQGSQNLWYMFVDEDDFYLENVKSGKIYRVMMEEVE